MTKVTARTMTIDEIVRRLKEPTQNKHEVGNGKLPDMGKREKPIRVEITLVNWMVPVSVAEHLPSHMTISLPIEHLAQKRVFERVEPNCFFESQGFNKDRFEECIVHHLIGEYSHTMRSVRYKVCDWGDSPFTMPQDDLTHIIFVQ